MYLCTCEGVVFVCVRVRVWCVFVYVYGCVYICMSVDIVHVYLCMCEGVVCICVCVSVRCVFVYV